MPLEHQREEILARATEVFAKEGFDGATSGQIAAASGVGRPTVYDLFGSKDDLFVAAVDRALNRIVENTAASLRATTDLRGREQLRVNIDAYFQLLTTEPATVRLMLMADSTGNAATREASRAIQLRLERAVAFQIEQTLDAHPIDPRDRDLAATIVLAAAQAAALRQLERPDRTIPELVGFVTEFLHRGLVWVDNISRPPEHDDA